MSAANSYIFDETVGVWSRREQRHEVLYSDGEDVESEILSIVTKVHDKSSGSDELDHPCMEWPFEYHFSASRAHLLMPFLFKGLDVLEIGAGCGALTRFLGEAETRTVIALEGSPIRAQITAARCRDLPNVCVTCDNFSQFESDRKFDIVLAIGVLEYAPIYFGGTDAVGCFLTKCRELLKDSGTLMIGIENQLGLKYFSGCREDHAGKLFFGLQDLYDRSKGFVTFGREDLIKKILAAGFSSTQFFYPFPDYKFPSAIFSEAGMRDPDFAVANIIAGQWARDYSVPRANLFSEQALWPVISRNLMAEHLSNSFLAFATKAGVSPLTSSVDWLAKLYNSNRKKRFRTVTTVRRGGGTIRFYKERLHPEMSEETSSVARLVLPQESEYIIGESVSHVLVKILLREETRVSDFVRALAPWCNLLTKNLIHEPGSHHQPVLPGNFIDCIPRNLISGQDVGSDPIYFDAEWNYCRPLPIQFVLFRGLLHSRVQCATGPAFFQTTLGTLMMEAFAQLGFTLSVKDLHGLIDAEADFQSLFTSWDRESWIEETLCILESPIPAGQSFERITQERDELSVKLAESEANVRNMKNSLSWRLTAPLRRGYRLVRRIRG